MVGIYVVLIRTNLTIINSTDCFKPLLSVSFTQQKSLTFL